jgi:imidazolonepropionase-like amidohydrolase
VHTGNKANNLLITNARLIDGTGAQPVVDRSILIQHGIITQIGEKIHIEGVRIIDASGYTVMPGLIDAHVHLESVPGSFYRNDNDDELFHARIRQLKAYLACGVTTVLDNGISSRQLREFNEHMRNGGAGPRIFALGPLFYPSGGYGDAVKMPHWGPFRASSTIEDIESLFDEYQEFNNIIGAKMTLEPGLGSARIWKIYGSKMRTAIAEAAKKRGLPVHVHALKIREQKMALEMGAYCLAHAGFFLGEPTEPFIDELKKKGVYVTTTLASTLGQYLVMFDLKRLKNDPLLELTVPPKQLKTARDPEAWKAIVFTLFKITSPGWMPSFLIRLLLKVFNLEKMISVQVKNSARAIVTMHHAGVPIVVGTDSANWPLFLNNFHGPSTILELEMLKEAGMDPLDIISSATRIPAEMMRKSGTLGTVEVGKRGDMIVVKDDPLKDIRALRSLSWTIKDGEARSPKEWMA